VDGFFSRVDPIASYSSCLFVARRLGITPESSIEISDILICLREKKLSRVDGFFFARRSDRELFFVFFVARSRGIGLGTKLDSGNDVSAVDPSAKIDKFASVRAERKPRMIGDRRNLEPFAANRTHALNHVVAPFDEDDPDPDCVLDEVDSVLGVDFVSVEAEGALSASAFFL
jgi:hypothetical protein